jgi:hypothetical protein
MEAFGFYAEPWLSIFPGGQKMKKRSMAAFLFPVMLLVLGLSGCGGSPGDGDGAFSDIDNSSGAANRGELAITGIDPLLYGTYRVYVNSVNSESSYKYNPAATASNVSVSGSTLTVKLSSGGSPWAGEGDYYVYLEDATGNLAAKSSRISFVNGGASKKASVFTVFGLIFTGINSRLYGNYRVYVSSGNEDTYNTGYLAKSDSTVSIQPPVARVNLTENGSAGRWTGSGSYYVFLESNTYNLKARSSSPVSFSDGNGTASSFIEAGRLTISINNSSLYGDYWVYISSGNEITGPTDILAASNTSVTINSSTFTTVDLTASSSSRPWTGTGSYYVFLEDSSSGNPAAISNGRVPFTLGNGTANSFTEIIVNPPAPPETESSEEEPESPE